MSAPAPVIFRWEGDSMIPLPRFAKQCDRDFVIGELYRMEVREEASIASRSHYFAALHDAWLNLPEQYADRFATPEHLRKYCLIRAGFHDERSIVCESKAQAQRVASFIKPLDEFSIVVARESVVTIYTAKSQSQKAMGKADFQRSKQAVLDEVAAMVGVSADDLAHHAGKAA